MAVTLSVAKRGVTQNQRYVDVDVTGPASYTTGGELLTVAQQATIVGENVASLDFTKIEFFDSEVNASLYQLALDKTNNKMLFTLSGAQATSTANLSAVTVRGRFYFGGVIG